MESRGLVFESRGDCLPFGLGFRSRRWPVRCLRSPPLGLNEWLLNVRSRPPPLSSPSERFLRFSRGCLSRFDRISPFVAGGSCVFLVFFLMFLLTSIKAYLCSGIVSFYRVNFGGYCPGEVKGLFWRSVYLPFMPHGTVEYTLNSPIYALH